MRIVIVAVHFDDQNKIASIRPRNFARWLAEFGHEVTVVTRSTQEVFRAEDPARVKVVRVPSPVRSDPLRKFLGQRFWFFEPWMWMRAAVREGLTVTEPHVIFSTFGPAETLLVGSRLARRWKGQAVWVADFRDLVVQEKHKHLGRLWRDSLQRTAVRKADAVTCVSRGLSEQLGSDVVGRERGKIHVIPNGFNQTGASPSSQMGVESPEGLDAILRITYTGDMYAGRRDATAIFQALSSLIDSGDIDPRKLEIHYAGRHGRDFLRQARGTELDECIIDHGFIEREAAIELQTRSDILLVLSWNTTVEKGILTGKVYEYLGSGRPILALTGGDQPNAELTELVATLEAGYAFEYVQREHQWDGLVQFLREAYLARQSGTRPELVPNPGIESYRYDRITRQLEGILHSLASKD